MIGSAASEAKQCTVGDAENSFTDGMTTFYNRKAVKIRKKRSGLHQSVFLWGATPVSLGKTKEMGSILHGNSSPPAQRIGDLATNEKKGETPW